MKGQSQLISVALLTLIMISMIGVTYMWGIPLIEKQKDTVKISNSERFMKELDDKIQNVIKNGGIQKISNPDVGGTFRLEDNGIKDVFVLETQTTGTDIATGKPIYVRGDARDEIYLGGETGVLEVLSEKASENTYDVTMELYYRNMTSSGSKYVIDIVGLGREVISPGENNIIISEGNSPTGPIGTEGNKEIYMTLINVRLE